MKGIDNPKVRRATRRYIGPKQQEHSSGGAGGMGGVAAAFDGQHSHTGKLQGHRGRKHFTPRHSATDRWKPGLRALPTPGTGSYDRPRGLRHIEAPNPKDKNRPEGRHFPERMMESKEHGDHFGAVGRKKIVLDPGTGEPCCERPADDFNLERAMGMKVRDGGKLIQRNGLGLVNPGDKLYASVEYSLGYYKNHLNGGGVLPGANWGFARATSSTRDSLRVFGRSLHELWARSPSIPAVVSMSLQYLERPETLVLPNLFQTVEERIRTARTQRSSARSEQKRSSRKGSGSDTAYEARVKLMRQIRGKFDKGQERQVDLPNQVDDPLVVSSLLTMFFKELTPPLLTYDLYDKMLDTQIHSDENERIASLRPAVASLPRPNQTVLAALISYLSQLVYPENSQYNGLTAHSLAEVFAPLLLRVKPRVVRSLGPGGVEAEARSAISCVHMLIANCEDIFQASALHGGARSRKQHIPFHIKRHIRGILEEIDSVNDLDAWENRTGLHVAGSDDEEEDYDSP